MTRVFEPRELSLGWYTPKDIQEISCCEVSVPVSFDAFNHPIPDGLYDLRMGPLDAKQQCQTCCLASLHCPGHFGHIVLSRPVFHPLLFETLFSLVRSTCFKCGFFKITDHERLLYYTRLKALKRGVVLDSPELFVSQKKPEEIECDLNSLEGASIHTKEVHLQITSEFLKRYSQKLKCPRCMERSFRISKSNNMSLFINTSKIGKSGEKGGTDDHASQADLNETVNSADVLRDSINTPQSTEVDEYFTPGNVKKIITKLFEKEGALLEEFFGMRDGSAFFVELLPITPNRFRPARYSQGRVYENPTNSLLGKIMSRSVAAEGDEVHWPELQTAVYAYFDGSRATPPSVGIKQVIEKKEGLFRRNIMGKRVNYAARSVISPDPHLHTREVGVPHVFARALTFPESVTPFNLDRLRGMVIRGPEYPGANFIQEGDALVSLAHVSRRARLAAANQLADGNKVVWRHLLDGDPVLLNRQPTLHAVSLMAHTVRVLRNENTLRIHYVNCKPYNADFDGDEMNIHLPQSLPGIAEALTVMHNDQNYFLPSAGRPIRGLEQDHVVAAARLTMKDTFLTGEEFSWVVQTGELISPRNTRAVARIKTLKPSILQPVRLYTGKQALTFVLHNLNCLINYNCIVNYSSGDPIFESCKSDSNVLIQDGALLAGVLTKKTLGAASKSLIHACGELYGYSICNDLLTNISRMVNAYISLKGYTVRFDDLLMDAEADEKRRVIFTEAEQSVLRDVSQIAPPEGFYHSDAQCAGFDAVMRGKMNCFTSRVVELLEEGLLKAAPHNNMESIIRTGAKGSIVNLSQICCALGQQELEGRRVPIMVSGRTLPCFRPCEWSPAAGGYVYERFLTGINPATFYFHSMAGREGLVDTAVKTASSGYLQRCLVKHMEGLKVEYDLSVRDNGRIIQFRYGDDGIDCTKESYLNDLKFFHQNPWFISKVLSCAGRVHETGASTPHGVNVTTAAHRLQHFKDEEFVTYKKKLSEIDPGKAVGVIAAQSIGEPSTQMTLNTFHLAGVGNKNVTLGIPRLSEILMRASKTIRTPMITLTAVVDEETRQRVVDIFSRITLDQLLAALTVTESVCQVAGEYKKRIKIGFEMSKYGNEAALAIDTQFLRLLGKEIKKRSSSVGIVDYVDQGPDMKENDEKEERDESESDVDSSATDDGEIRGGAAVDAGSDDQDGADNEAVDETDDEEDSQDNHVGQKADNELNSSEPERFTKLINLKKITHRKYAFTVDYPANFSVWMMPLVEAVCKRTVVREIPGLKNASWSGNTLTVEGSNFLQLVKTLNEAEMDSLIDAHTAYSNDIYSVYTLLGVEAARSVIVQEITNVFEVYGININIRHLYLVADYMTRRGGYDPFHRISFSMDDSLVQRASFESSYANLKKSALFFDSDPLNGPSASICVGNRMKHGTGAFDLWYKLDT